MSDASTRFRVLEVVGSLAVGGAERVAVEIAAGIAARGHEAEIGIASPGTGDRTALRAEARGRGLGVVDLPFPFLNDPRNAARAARELLDGRFDVVHAHNRPQDWQLVTLGVAVGLPVAYTVHSATPLTPRQRALYATAGRAASAVVCVSHTVARHVVEVERMPERALRVIHNGIDLARFVPPTDQERAAKRRALGWKDSDFVWICAARLAPPKAHRFLIDAMARVDAGSRARLVLAGDGPLRGEIEAQVERLGVGGRVTLLGARDDVPALLGAADGFASSSVTEGHPLSLLEAMAIGLVVVAPRLPSVLEIEGPTGPLLYGPEHTGAAPSHDPAEIASALAAVERAPAVHREAARQCRAHVEARFSLRAMIDAHEALYGELAARRSLLSRARRRAATALV